MNDETQVRQLFDELLSSITDGDQVKLCKMADNSLAVRHRMTGVDQSGTDFISDVENEKFRFYSFKEKSTDLRVIGVSAFVIGKFTADAAIYGMERAEHKLCMKSTLRKGSDGWKYTEIRISSCIDE